MKIKSSSEYKSKEETSTSSILSLYTFSLPISLPFSLLDKIAVKVDSGITDIYYDFSLRVWLKKELILFSIKELSKALSAGVSTLYISDV